MGLQIGAISLLHTIYLFVCYLGLYGSQWISYFCIILPDIFQQILIVGTQSSRFVIHVMLSSNYRIKQNSKFSSISQLLHFPALYLTFSLRLTERLTCTTWETSQNQILFLPPTSPPTRLLSNTEPFWNSIFAWETSLKAFLWGVSNQKTPFLQYFSSKNPCCIRGSSTSANCWNIAVQILVPELLGTKQVRVTRVTASKQYISSVNVRA